MSNDLVGRKVKAVFEDVRTGIPPNTYMRKVKRLDPVFLDELMSRYPRYRIKRVGGVYTADYSPSRANVHVTEFDDYFEVTEVSFG
jgi:hypothetical protein